MAKEMKEYTPQAKKGPKFKYPWDDWFNGSFWRLVQGEDFECKVSTMEDMIRKTAAGTYELKVTIHKEGENALVIQAYEEDED